MEATDILYEEHRIIMKVLECLQKMVQEAEKNGRLDEESAQKAIDFFRNFADGCHHAKEEDHLFGVMQEQGIPNEGGPISVMLSEHDEGRRFVRGMSQAVEKASNGDSAALTQFAENAHDFVALLVAHISKEDQVLFPMADRIIDEPGAGSLLTDFKKIEADAGGRRHRDYMEIAKQLCNRYGVSFVDEVELQTIRKAFAPN